MSIIKDNAKLIDQLSSFLSPLLQLGPELKRVGSLEDYEARLKKNIDTLNKDQEQINNEIKLARQELNNDRDKAKKELNSQREDLNNYKKDAEKFNSDKRKEADDVLADARRKASEIVSSANIDANSIKEGALASIQDNLKEIAAKQEIIKSLDADIATRNKVLDDINKKLDKLRS